VTEVRVIPMSELLDQLSPDDALTAVAVALEELALMEALTMIHGRARAAQVYVERGGHVRFDDNGEPVLLWTEGLASRAQPAGELP
jgi:hypothetical protein